MRPKWGLVVIVLTLAFNAGCEKNNAQKSGQAVPVESFEFLVELSGSSAKLEAHNGTNWKVLTYGGQDNERIEFWLNRQGVSGDESGLVGSGFVIAIQATAYGAVLKSKTGTYWSELAYDCGGKTPCRFIIDQNGVRGVE